MADNNKRPSFVMVRTDDLISFTRQSRRDVDPLRAAWVLAYLRYRSGDTRRWLAPTITKRIAGLLGCSVRTVQKHLSYLVSLGELERRDDHQLRVKDLKKKKTEPNQAVALDDDPPPQQERIAL